MEKPKRMDVISGKVRFPETGAAPAAPPESDARPECLTRAIRRHVDRLLWLAFRGHEGGDNHVR